MRNNDKTKLTIRLEYDVCSRNVLRHLHELRNIYKFQDVWYRVSELDIDFLSEKMCFLFHCKYVSDFVKVNMPRGL